jgi:hypothetical protein
MNTLLEFSSKSNIELLWDILLDELNISTNKQLILNVNQIFQANLKPFISKANPNKTLINLNKDFLGQVMVAVNKLIPNLKQEQQLKIINISDDNIDDIPYKIEEIQTTRLTKFEKELQQKRLEFENIINPPKPKKIDFSDKQPTDKIQNMELLIAETINRRNFDVEPINDWTKSNETTTPIVPKKVTWDDNNTTYISNYNENNIIEEKDEKYNNEINNNEINNNEINNNQINNNQINNLIFNKLKKINKEEQHNNIKNDINNINERIDKLYEMVNNILTILQDKK